MTIGVRELIVLSTLLVPLALVLVALIGNRPRADRFFAVNELDPRPRDVEHVDAVLRLTRRSRVAGAVVGCVLGGVTASASLGIGGVVAGAGIGLLAGTMLGITIAQPRARAPLTTVRVASLEARDASDYLPRRAYAHTLVLAVFLGGYAAVAMITASVPLTSTMIAIFATGAATILSVPIGHVFQQRTVELRRPDVDAESVRVDDTLRASALRGIHHATLGILMCGLILVGYGAIATQNVTTVRVGSRVVLRVASETMNAVPDPFLVEQPTRFRINWTEPGGARRTKIVRTQGAPLTFDSPHVGPLLGVGFWVALVAFLGALVEWSRAAKAWRRPQTTPAMIGAAR